MFKKRKSAPDYITRLDHALNQIAKCNDQGIYQKLIKSFLLEAQAPFLNLPYSCAANAVPDVRNITYFWPWLKNDPEFSQNCYRPNQSQQIDFSHDVVIASPWNIQRHTDAYCQHGEGRARGAWEYDPVNHYVAFYAPINLAIAHNGLHSITQGILERSGSFPSQDYYDLSSIFMDYQCDGHSYYHIGSGQVAGKVDSRLWAMIFYTARHMLLNDNPKQRGLTD